ncbi:DUF6290 family protein [Brachyspira hyodysenteriae]|uniref:DUF6290 family protein n=1 Tax=Brachyspira hyodysenteriae TaxID=159 RepID=UPI003B982EDC
MPKGGYREGSGRKKITENRLDIKLYMRVSEEEQLLIKEKANQNNISVAEYIRQAVLDKFIVCVFCLSCGGKSTPSPIIKYPHSSILLSSSLIKVILTFINSTAAIL